MTRFRTGLAIRIGTVLLVLLAASPFTAPFAAYDLSSPTHAHDHAPAGPRSPGLVTQDGQKPHMLVAPLVSGPTFSLYVAPTFAPIARADDAPHDRRPQTRVLRI